MKWDVKAKNVSKISSNESSDVIKVEYDDGRSEVSKFEYFQENDRYII